MTMRVFKQQKMWRDKMVATRESEGSKFQRRRLDDREFDEQLRIKLIEEADEVRCASSRTELIEELADVLEVIDALCGVHGLTHQEIAEVKAKKHALRGGFDERIFVEIVEHPVGSHGEKYCLANAEKYPEIIGK